MEKFEPLYVAVWNVKQYSNCEKDFMVPQNVKPRITVSPNNPLQSMYPKDLGLYKHRLEEGNGTPLQCSCLDNPMDGGAW